MLQIVYDNLTRLLFMKGIFLFFFYSLVAVSGNADEGQKTDEANNDQSQWTVAQVAPTNNAQSSSSPADEQQTMHENGQLLQALTNYIVKENRCATQSEICMALSHRDY